MTRNVEAGHSSAPTYPAKQCQSKNIPKLKLAMLECFILALHIII